MNYHHGFHAGNFADVVKHSLLALLLEALGAKSSPWHYYDSHAGAGAYDLSGEAARRSGEAAGGILKLWTARGSLPAAAERLCDIVAALDTDLPARTPPRLYPGSPRVALALARDSDRLTLAEIQPQEARLLKSEFKREPRVAVHERDGYEMLRALTPPAERRGLVLLDPPYESPKEFDCLVESVKACHGRWPGGIYALWYPIKDETARKRFLRSMERSGIKRTLLTEFRLGPQGEGLNGSGMLVVNPPWQSDAAMWDCLKDLLQILAPESGSAEVGWLVPE